MTRSEDPASRVDSRNRVLLTLGCAVAGAMVDWFAPTIFAGHSLVLGLVFYWLVLVRLGPHAALIPLLAITATLWFKWSQPYSAALIAFEGLVVGWAWRKHYNPVLADLLYWVVFGTPLSWFFYSQIYPIPHPAFDYALIVQAVNGLIAIWIAFVFAGMLPEAQKYIRSPQSETLKQFILKRCAIFGTIPILVAALVTGRYFEAGSIDQANQNSIAVARQLALEIARQVTAAQHAVITIAARFATVEEFSQTSRLAQNLEQARSGSTSFITLLAADSHGVIQASVRSEPPAPAGGQSVADREYFGVPIKTGAPYLSDVFQGRGFGTATLVAVSAPIVTLDGVRLGVIEGSILTSFFEVLLQQSLSKTDLRAVITDRHRSVIAATGWDLAPLNKVAGTRLGQVIESGGGKPVRYTDEKSARRESFSSISVPVPGTSWSLTVQRPWAGIMRPVATVYLISFIVALAVVALAALFITRSIRGLLSATRAFEKFTRAPAEYAPELQQLASSEGDVPGEVRELMRHLAKMAAQLRTEAAQREQFVGELESRVKLRTHEMEGALVAAQAADRAKSTFLATISHELRTPLTAIITGVALLKRMASAGSGSEVRILSTLDKSSQALMHVIASVLDYSKISAGGLEISCRPFLPISLVKDVVDLLSLAARESSLTLTGESTCAPDAKWHGDAPHLLQVLLNLVGNAIKFTPSGTVSLKSWVAEATNDLPRRLHFAVIDSGSGIPFDRQQAIFEPFVQLENSQTNVNAGTGLGLPISQKLVSAMGGKITLESRPGQGSTFQFWVPERLPEKNVEAGDENAPRAV